MISLYTFSQAMLLKDTRAAPGWTAEKMAAAVLTAASNMQGNHLSTG
jgi:hypothetical protein